MRLRPDRLLEAHIGLGILISALWLLTHAAAPQKAVINFKSQTVVYGDSIVLENIADIYCYDPLIKSKLKNFYVGQPTLPGQMRRMSTEKVKSIIEEEYQGLVSFVFKGSRMVHVETGSVAISGIEMREAVRDYIFEHMPWDPANVLMSFISMPQEIKLKDKNISVKIRPEKDMAYMNGERFFYEVYRGSKKIRSVPIAVELRVFQDICVAAQKIKRRTRISPEMITMEKKEVTKQKHKTFVSPDSIIGMQAKRTIYAHRVIDDSMIKPWPLINSGDQVTLVSICGSTKITAVGTAREAGAAGDKIDVKHSGSHKILKGVVQADASVLVSEKKGEL
ncbi:MAG: flagellar basal body P-ring formation chaperone FlgA [bacterium]